MTTTPNGQPANDPSNNGAQQNDSPEKPKLPRYIVRWFRGFHLHRDKPKVTDCLTVVLTLVVGIAAIYSAWVFDGQLREMRRQTSQNLESFRIDERAWVEIGNIDRTVFAPDPPFGTTFKYVIYPKNVGKTLATGVRLHIDNIDADGTFADNEKAIRMYQDQLFRDSGTGKRITTPDRPGPQSIAPGEQSAVPVYSGGQEPKQYGNSFRYAYIVGRIDYIDVFKIAHCKRLCFIVMNARGELGHCQFGNDEDANPEKPPN